MVLRGFVWLAALAALAGALASGLPPEDPPRSTHAAAAGPDRGSCVLVFSWADLDPRVGSLPMLHRDRSGAWATSCLRPAPRLAAFHGTPPDTQAVCDILLALWHAEGQDLEGPVRIKTALRFRPPATPQSRAWQFDRMDEARGVEALILPTGAVAISGRLKGESDLSSSLVPRNPELPLAGAVLVSAPDAALKDRERSWQVDRQRAP